MVVLLNEHSCRDENDITTVVLGNRISGQSTEMLLPGIQGTCTWRTVQQAAGDRKTKGRLSVDAGSVDRVCEAFQCSSEKSTHHVSKEL
jgi:hypothetical protein